MTRFRPTIEREETPAAVTLEALYRRYSGWLVAILRKRFGDGVAEDLAQDAYVRMSGVDMEEVRHPKALLLKVAMNVGRTQSRRATFRNQIASLAPDQDAAELEIPAPADEDALLKEIVLGLDPLYRDVFLLSRFAGMTYDSIAAHLGISVATVERRLAKAIALCAAQLRD